MSTFAVKQPFLEEVLNDVENGTIQLPDFQREWVWDDHHIRSLIASVSQSFPIGVVLELEAGGEDMRFETRLLKGVDPQYRDVEAKTLILDGQQRLTALFQALMSKEPVSTQNTRGNQTLRYYYLDMEACIKDEIEREEAVLSCGKDGRLQTVQGKNVVLFPIGALLARNSECANNMFPVDKIFESAAWRREYLEYWENDRDKSDLFDEFEDRVINHFKRYTVPIIQLRNKTSKEAVCLVFEKVNTRGVTLTVFELLVASFAGHKQGFKLRDDWNSRCERMKEEFRVLEELESTNFLRALTLLVTNANPETPISCTRREILRLTSEDYQKWKDQVEEGFKKAACFLQSQKIFNARDLPYQTQLVPLAAILYNLKDKEEIGESQEKIARWYWCGVLGEMYGAATDTRFANDLSEVTAWVKGTENAPRTVSDANFQENRLLELRTRNSAAYKGVHALIMHEGECRDFITGSPYDFRRIIPITPIHHIFPKAWCKRKGIKRDNYDSIINKTVLSADTNLWIGSKAPSEYLQEIQKETGIDESKLDEILASHLICPSALRADDFDRFFEARKEALLAVIEKAMGKPIIRENEN